MTSGGEGKRGGDTTKRLCAHCGELAMVTWVIVPREGDVEMPGKWCHRCGALEVTDVGVLCPMCECGRDRSIGRCGICDNDE